MKYSNEHRRLSQLLAAYRDSLSPSSSNDRLKPYKDLVTDLYPYDPTVKDKVIELLKYQYHLDDLNEFLNWQVPIFPISAGMLTLKGIKQGGNYRIILYQLREVWKQSNFEANEQQLLNEYLPNILKSLPNLTDIEEKLKINLPAFALVKKRKHKSQPGLPVTQKS